MASDKLPSSGSQNSLQLLFLLVLNNQKVITHFSSLGENLVVLLVYVDDIIVASAFESHIQSIRQQLEKLFKLKFLGDLRYFLGLEIAKSPTGILLSQHKYTLNLLEDVGFIDCKPELLPMEPKLVLLANDGDPVADPSQYRRSIGRLMYLTISRLDICYVVNKLSQFMGDPRASHLQALHYLLRHLKRTPEQGLLFSSSSPLQLQAYVDADCGSCVDTRRLTTEFCVLISDSLVSWKSKKQPTMSRSSAEAEYRALASVTSEITWLTNLLKDFEVAVPLAMVYCDNQATIHIAVNPSFHERSKHIEIDCHFTREKANEGVIKLVHAPSKHQVADLLTKPLPHTQFMRLMSKLGTLNPYLPT